MPPVFLRQSDPLQGVGSCKHTLVSSACFNRLTVTALTPRWRAIFCNLALRYECILKDLSAVLSRVRLYVVTGSM